MNSEQSEKYSRQILFPGIGAEGQEKLLTGNAALVGTHVSHAGDVATRHTGTTMDGLD